MWKSEFYESSIGCGMPIADSNSSLKAESDWMTTAEVATFLRVSRGQIRNWTSNGKLPYHKIGRLNRYSRTELEDLLRRNKRGGF